MEDPEKSLEDFKKAYAENPEKARADETKKTLAFEKSFSDFLLNKLPKIDMTKESLEQGYPVSYMDDKGRYIQEHPNGDKFLLIEDNENHRLVPGEKIND